MSVENELEERLNLQEGDDLISVEALFNLFAKKRVHEKLPEFSESEMYGYVAVKREEGKWGIYTSNGDIVIPEDYYRCWPEFFSCREEGDCHYHEVICIERDGKVEVRSCNGQKVIVPSKYKKVELGERFIWTSNNEITYGAYSYEGKEILPPEFKILYSENIGEDFILICANANYLYGVYSGRGEVIIPCEYKTIRFTKDHQSLFVRKQDGTEAMYSVEGEPIIDCNAHDLRWNSLAKHSIFANGRFPNDFILASRNQSPVGLYRYTGKKIVVDPTKYSKMYLEKEYIICIGKDGVSMDVYDFEGDKILEFKP